MPFEVKKTFFLFCTALFLGLIAGRLTVEQPKDNCDFVFLDSDDSKTGVSGGDIPLSVEWLTGRDRSNIAKSLSKTAGFYGPVRSLKAFPESGIPTVLEVRCDGRRYYLVVDKNGVWRVFKYVTYEF